MGVTGATHEERERERSLLGLPANVCHRFIVKLLSVQLTVEKMDQSNPVGETHNDNNPHKTSQNLSVARPSGSVPL